MYRHPRSLQSLALLALLTACSTGSDDGTAGGGTTDTGDAADGTGEETSTDTGAGDTDSGRADTDDRPVEERDQDDDGIPDVVEGNLDPDGDGNPNWSDSDSDNDGVADLFEGQGDSDEDGIPDRLDRDADGDGFDDGIEGTGDPDGDGLPNFQDIDADGDGRIDLIEGAVDTDFDGLIDPYDADDDNDGALSVAEGGDDADNDGLPAWADPDSDNDRWSDGDEIDPDRTGVSSAPDSDADGAPDHEDIDSDSDGLRDRDESGCADGSTERALADSDGDGISDLVERAFRSADDRDQACDPAEGVGDNVDFFFTLPYDGVLQEDTLEFNADVRKGDVAFNMDTTGSMGGSISGLQSSLRSVIIPELGARIADVAYAVSSFDDFPCATWGSPPNDRPFILRQRVTTSELDAQAGVDLLVTHGGNDLPESGIEALYQIATGSGRIAPTCTPANERELVPRFDWRVDRVTSIADGRIGGVGFREGSVPIVVHITDATSHARGEGGYDLGASRVEATNALDEIGAKVIGVSVGSFGGTDVRRELEELAVATGAAVPPCAWDAGRPAACRAGSCCTGSGGAGSPANADGLCPLVYASDSSGAGLDSSIVQGIEALVQYARFDVSLRIRGNPVGATEDSTCFIQRIYPVFADPGESLCASTPALDDIDGDGAPDGFQGVTPGASLFFVVEAQNRCAEEISEPQVFTAFVDIVSGGGAVLDTQTITILVPPAVKPE
jgi:hypothetical protein